MVALLGPEAEEEAAALAGRFAIGEAWMDLRGRFAATRVHPGSSSSEACSASAASLSASAARSRRRCLRDNGLASGFACGLALGLGAGW